MPHDRRKQAREIFMQVAEVPEDQRPAALDRLCGCDFALREEVEVLLRADRRAAADQFMNEPTGSVKPTTAAAPITETAGTRIGLYKLLQQIGEGGFGVVFMAEQERPVRRRVALKIIKLGMDTRQVVARFEQERQALALMDHPNIAKVLDAGATESGRPYFVMEYVAGDPITTFADAHKLSVRERLELFSQVCSAVQHAHTKGIIHRDIKPRNVLVSMTDGRSLARVIDFGIAKATGSPLTDKTLFTEHRQLIGTPEYMSPEQAEGSPDIDTRTDVYALGVLLYELLTGATPFDSVRLRSAAYAEMQRIIKEEEPPAPSLRLSRSLSTLAATAAARKSEPEKLGGLIKGELDWIVLKALDKDRARRYETPNQFAQDVRRHLAGEAVIAAPPSAFYRMGKFMRKHSVPVFVGSAAIVGLMLVTSAIVWQNIRIGKQNAILLEERKRSRLADATLTIDSLGQVWWPSERNAAKAREALDVFVEYLGHNSDTTLEAASVLATALNANYSEGKQVEQNAIDAYYASGGTPSCLSLSFGSRIAQSVAQAGKYDEAVIRYNRVVNDFRSSSNTLGLDCTVDTGQHYSFVENFITDEVRGDKPPKERTALIEWINSYPNRIREGGLKRLMESNAAYEAACEAEIKNWSDLISFKENVNYPQVLESGLQRRRIYPRFDDPTSYTFLGIAYYRVGNYTDALGALDKAERLYTNPDTYLRGPAENQALIAMSYQRLGHADKAKASLATLRDFMKGRDWVDDADAMTLSAEAETLIEGRATTQPAVSHPTDQPASSPASLPESRPGGTARE